MKPMSLDEFTQARYAATASVHQEFDCAHAEVMLTRRTIHGGGIQYRMQCRRCGVAVGNAVSRATVLAMGAEPADFDEEYFEDYQQRRRDALDSVRENYSQEKWFRPYDAYLATPEWAAKRHAVMQRANGRCEGCGERAATQVHHLTYAHVGHEFLFELVAICTPCHERIHEGESE